jgi:hypothetical protein
MISLPAVFKCMRPDPQSPGRRKTEITEQTEPYNCRLRVFRYFRLFRFSSSDAGDQVAGK